MVSITGTAVSAGGWRSWSPGVRVVVRRLRDDLPAPHPDHPDLRVPRLDSPRERVPAGSVAIADEFSAVYPAATPGGWRLLGRCDQILFDVDRDPPALLQPGTRVRFTAS